MRFSRERRSEPDLDVTPLIDVVFLLLIFFMVSATFQRDSALRIRLPEATEKASESPNRVIDVAVDAEGRFYVDGHQLVNTQIDSLKRALRRAIGNDTKSPPPVVINADASTHYQAMITVMDAARQLGLVRLTFAARLAPKAGK